MGGGGEGEDRAGAALEAAHDDVELAFETGRGDPGIDAGGHVSSQCGGIIAHAVEALRAGVALLHVTEVAASHRVLPGHEQGMQLQQRLVAQVGISPATEPPRRARHHGMSLSPRPARGRTPGRRRAGVAGAAAHGTGAPGSWSPCKPVTSLTSRVVAPSIWLNSTTVRCRSGSRPMAPISRSPRSRRRAKASGVESRGTATRSSGLASPRSSAAIIQRARAASCLHAIQAAVDQDAREPHLERPAVLEIAQVRVRLDERVLHGLVGFGRVAQVVQGDPRRLALVPADQFPVQLARSARPGRRRDGP